MERRALIIGWGRSGKAAAVFLEDRGYRITVFDDQLPSPKEPLQGVELVVLSPGIPEHHPLVRSAEAQGLHVVGEIELGLSALQGRSVGITGTNGKTTVTHLVTEVLRRTGRRAQALGNIGTALTSGLGAPYNVIEFSSFQLERAKSCRLDAAAILNITPDHLDHHGSLPLYAAAKARIQQLILPGGILYCQLDVLRQFPDLFTGTNTLSFGLSPQADLFTDGRRIFRQSNIECNVSLRYRMGRQCDLENLLAAFALTCALGVTPEEFEALVEGVERLPHRTEWVRKMDGVLYINDSKATNIGASLAAVESVEPPIVLIAGGRNKGGDFRLWKEPFKGRVRQIVAIGEAKESIENCLAPALPVLLLSDLKEAVTMASQLAGGEGTVLLSPGCSSLDQFKNYEERGERFRQLVLQL